MQNKSIRNVRKFNLNNELACLSDELLEYMGINTKIENLISHKGLQKGFDFEIIPRHIMDSKVNLSKYSNKNEFVVLKTNGIYKIIKNRRQTESIQVANSFKINLGFIKEREYLSIIKSAFNHYNCKQQYYVPREEGKGYFIDLYIKGEDKNIAIEVDENGHNTYDSEFEINRELYIKEKLGCEFVRFNPDTKGFNVGEVINKILTTNSKPLDTKISYYEYSVENEDVVKDIIKSLAMDENFLISFIDELQIENIHNGIGSNLTYKKNIKDDGYTVFVGGKPILDSKSITGITVEEDTLNIEIEVKYHNKRIDKIVYIQYILEKNEVHIKLLGGFKKDIYIQEYINMLEY